MMPNLLNAVRRFENTLQFELVKKTIIDGEVAETSKLPITTMFEGTVQALQPRELSIKPEGERSFKWLTLWTDMHLLTDDVIKDQRGVEYRVMNSTDWGEADYFQYQLIEGATV